MNGAFSSIFGRMRVIFRMLAIRITVEGKEKQQGVEKKIENKCYLVQLNMIKVFYLCCL